MQLLVVTQYFWPENFRVNDLVEELVQRGHEVTVLTGVPNYPDGKVFDDFVKDPQLYARYAGAEVVRVPMLPRGRGGLRLMMNYITFAASASILGAWKLRGRHFDAIFAYEPSPITVGLPAAMLRRFKCAPLVFWVLDLWPETLQAIGVVKSRVVLRAVGKLVTFIYNRCDVVLAQSKSFIPQIRKYAAAHARVEYFPSWAETVFEAEPATPASEVPVQPDAFNVMFAGNIGDAQDFPAILDAAALSFLGLGAQPPTPEWGSMIGQERNQVFTAPHLIIFPGLALMLTVLGFNLLGDGLRDALDPRLNR